MDVLIIPIGRGSPSTTAVRYSHLTQNNWTSSNLSQVMPVSGTITEFKALCGAAPGAGKSWTLDLMINGSATSLGSIADSATTLNLTPSISISAGDLVSVRCTPSGTPTSAYVIFNFRLQTAASTSLGIGSTGAGTFSTAGTSYIAPNSIAASGGTESGLTSICPCDGTISNFYASLNSAPGAGNSYTFSVRQNAVDTAVTCTIADTNTEASDLSNSFSISKGDRLNIKIVPSSAFTAIGGDFGFKFTPAVDGETPVFMGCTQNLVNSGTTYNYIQTANTTWDSTESNRECPNLFAHTIKNLYFGTNSTPGAGTSYTLSLRSNGTDTGITATIADTATSANDTTNTYNVTAGDLINYMCVPSGTPTVRLSRAGYVRYIAPASSGGFMTPNSKFWGA